VAIGRAGYHIEPETITELGALIREPIMSKLVRLIGATILTVALAASPVFARDGGRDGGFHGGGFHDGGFHRGFRGGVPLGGRFINPFFFDPYFGAYPYPVPYAAAPPVIWYYCPPYDAYFPDVPSCPVQWQAVYPR
jgi:hypothetical protein